MATNKLEKAPNATAVEFADERDSNGFFIITEETEDFTAPDPTLDQEERITQAIEIFDAAMNHKITRAYLFKAPLKKL